MASSMAMPARRAAAVAAAAAAGAAATASPAELRSAPPPGDLLAQIADGSSPPEQQAKELIKEALKEAKKEGVLVSTRNEADQEWLDVGHEYDTKMLIRENDLLDGLLDLGADVVQDPVVAARVAQVAEQRVQERPSAPLTLLLLEAQHRPARPSPYASLTEADLTAGGLGSSLEYVRPPAEGVESIASSSPLGGSVTASEIAAAELTSLREMNCNLARENDELRVQNRQLSRERDGETSPPPPAAAAHGTFAYDKRVLLPVTPPAVRAKLLVVAPSSGDAEAGAAPTVRLELRIGSPSAATSTPRRGARENGAPALAKKSALVVSVGVIVGLLALVLSNNPRGARTAAKAAAATVVALFERYQQRAK